MKYYQKFLLFSRGKQIAFVVSFVHLCAVFSLLCHHFISGRLRPPRPMVVRTLAALPEIKRTPPIKLESPPAKTTAQQKKAAPPAAPKAKPKPGIKPKPSPAAKKTEAEPALKEIAESFEILTREAARSRPSLSIPSKIQPKTEIGPSKEDPTYGEYLIAFLQSSLDLPEYGEVRARLEIDRFGNLVECQILEAKSEKNAEFLKNRLPELSFPCLNDGFHSLTITFRNVEVH